jgi:hypothetical protein
MAEWSDVANSSIELVTKHPWRAFLLGIALVGCGLYYMTHRHEDLSKSTVTVQTTGSHGQTAGANDGTMKQINK